MRATVTHRESITFDGHPACRIVCKLESTSAGEPFGGRLVLEAPDGPDVGGVFEVLVEPVREPIPLEPTTEKVPADRGGKGEK